MFEWKVEDLKLKQEYDNATFKDKYIFECESKTSREDKIAFVDSRNDGKLSELLRLRELYQKEKDNLPKDRWGEVKGVSLKAWLKRNDKNDLFKYNDRSKINSVSILGLDRFIGSDFVFEDYSDFEDEPDEVDELFHRTLKKCLDEEQQYFNSTSNKELKESIE